MFLLRYLTFLGNLFPQLLVCILLLAIDFDKGYQVGSLWFYGYIINLIIKNTVRKTRPPKEFWRVPHVNGHSFPSGHSLTSLVLYWSIAKYFDISFPCSIIFYALPFILGASRLYLRVHFLEDVLCGWIIAYTYLAMGGASVLKFQENFYGIFYKISHCFI